MHKNVLIRRSYALFLLMLFSLSAYSQNSWIGKVSTDWGTAANWSNDVVPGTNDNIQIGPTAFNFQPMVNGNYTVHNLTFGGPSPVILSVNSGYTLTVSGQLVQDHAADNSLPSTTITGNGNLSVLTVMIGDLTTPKLVQSKTTTFISSIASFTVTGNITLNTTTGNLLTGGIANNNCIFSLQGGILNLTGQIITTNQIPANCNTFAGNYPKAKFSIDINSNQNATLILADSNAVSLANATYGQVDFYNPVSGTGRSLVKYAGSNQLVYTNTVPGIDTYPANYQDLAITGSGTKIAGTTSSANVLSIAGNLNITGGLLDLLTFSPQTIVNGNFTNYGAVNLGTSTTTFNGTSFFNAGNFAVNTGIVRFSGGAQTLIDSTLNGTNFNKVTFNNSGIKNIQSGTFAVIPNGKVRLSNNASLNVTAAAGLYIRADSTGYAAIAALATGCSVTGQVNVGQYFQGSVYLNNSSARGYRILSSPVNYTGTLTGDRYFNLNYLRGTTNYNGLLVTGVSGGGFDYVANPNMYLFREDVTVSNCSLTCGVFKGIAQINYTDPNLVGTQQRFTTADVADTSLYMPVGTGIFFYFRGNKVPNNGTTTGTKTTAPFNYPEDVTVMHTGVVNQGNVFAKDWFRSDHFLSFTNSSAINNTGDQGYSMLGNPYPAPINWDNFSPTDSTSSLFGPNLSSTISVYNPANGQYNTYVADSTHDRTQIYYGTGIASNIIASSAGFMVLVNASSANPYAASLTFKENSKYDPDAGSTPGTFLTENTPSSLFTTFNQRSEVLPQSSTATKTTVVAASSSSFATSTQKSVVLQQSSTTNKGALTAANQSAVTVKNANTPSSAGRSINKLNKTAPQVLVPIIRLELFQENDTVRNDDILIRFKAGATSVYNPKEDAFDLGGNEEAVVMLSSYSSNHTPLSINTWPLPKKAAAIMLFTDGVNSGKYIIKSSAITNMTNYELRLKDKFNGKSINLQQATQYGFTIDKNKKATYGDRFELLIIKK